jgi:hypothetical protein
MELNVQTTTAKLIRTIHRTALLLVPLLSLIISPYKSTSQTLSWGSATRDSSTPIGGQSQRVGVGGVEWNGNFWVAYTGTTIEDSKGDAYVYTAYNTGGTTWGNKQQVVVHRRKSPWPTATRHL